MPPNIARFIRGWDEVDVDLRVVGGLALLAVASTVVFGLLPALRASRVSLNDALKSGGRTTGGGGRHRLRNTMVVVEVALALTLLVAAGLSVRGTTTVLFRDDGYDPDGVMTLRVSLLGARYDTPDKRRAFFESLVDDARGVLGIEGVALANVAPASMRNASSAVEIEGHPVADAAERRSADFRVTTPGYFQTLRIRLTAGPRLRPRRHRRTRCPSPSSARRWPAATGRARIRSASASRWRAGRRLDHRRRRRPRRPPHLVHERDRADVLRAVRAGGRRATWC